MRLHADDVMKNASKRIAHRHPPTPKMMVPTTTAANAPLLSKL
jgi:hypothetical protein